MVTTYPPSNENDPPKDEELSSPPHPPSTTPQPSKRTLTLTHHTGSLFSTPQNSILIHACNAQGSWGGGIARTFRTLYPNAYTRYRAHCLTAHNPRTNPVPLGTCLLIPPCETKSGTSKHWIACLFTSGRYGKGKDKPEVILEATGRAMRKLLQQVREVDGEVGGLAMCRVNSGKFGVAWEDSVSVLKGVEVREGERETAQVWSLEG